jgi:DNA-binding CsgD family transcriptional regulator
LKQADDTADRDAPRQVRRQHVTFRHKAERGVVVMSDPDEIDPDFSRLLEATYSSTADPAVYDDLLEVWERYMTRHPDLDRNGPHLPHFNKALQIFSSMGRRRRRQSRDAELLGGFSTPALLCGRDLSVKAMNRPARALFNKDAEGLLTQDALADAIRGLTLARRSDFVPLLDGSGKLVDCAVIALQESAVSEEAQDNPDQTCLVVLTKPGAPDSLAWRQLATRFGLSGAEAEVLHALLDGNTPDAIAAARGVSLNTVRTQVRRLLEKTGANSLADLIRSALLICTQLETVTLATRHGRSGGAPLAVLAQHDGWHRPAPARAADRATAWLAHHRAVAARFRRIRQRCTQGNGAG